MFYKFTQQISRSSKESCAHVTTRVSSIYLLKPIVLTVSWVPVYILTKGQLTPCPSQLYKASYHLDFNEKIEANKALVKSPRSPA